MHEELRRLERILPAPERTTLAWLLDFAFLLSIWVRFKDEVRVRVCVCVRTRVFRGRVQNGGWVGWWSIVYVSAVVCGCKCALCARVRARAHVKCTGAYIV